MSESFVLILKWLIGAAVLFVIVDVYLKSKKSPKKEFSPETNAFLGKMEHGLEDAVRAYLNQGTYNSLYPYCTEQFLYFLATGLKKREIGHTIPVEPNEQTALLKKNGLKKLMGKKIEIIDYRVIDENKVLVSISHEQTPFPYQESLHCDFILIRENGTWKFDYYFMKYPLKVLEVHPQEGHTLYCMYYFSLEHAGWHLIIEDEPQLKEGDVILAYAHLDYDLPLQRLIGVIHHYEHLNIEEE